MANKHTPFAYSEAELDDHGRFMARTIDWQPTRPWSARRKVALVLVLAALPWALIALAAL